MNTGIVARAERGVQEAVRPDACELGLPFETIAWSTARYAFSSSTASPKKVQAATPVTMGTRSRPTRPLPSGKGGCFRTSGQQPACKLGSLRVGGQRDFAPPAHGQAMRGWCNPRSPGVPGLRRSSAASLIVRHWRLPTGPSRARTAAGVSAAQALPGRSRRRFPRRLNKHRQKGAGESEMNKVQLAIKRSGSG